MNIDLTPIFQAIIALLAALVTYKIVPWIKSKTTNEQRKALSAAVNVMVYAAEQVYGAGHGAEKLQYVKDKLKERGYDVDVEAIEAAVKNLSLQQSFAEDGVVIPVYAEAVEDEDGDEDDEGAEDEDPQGGGDAA